MSESLTLLKILTVITATLYVAIKFANALEGKCQPIRLANGRPRIQRQGKLVRFRCYKGYEFVGRRYMNCFQRQWDYQRDPSINYPMCVRPGCRASSYVNGHFLETYKGAVVSVVCNLGYALHGSPTVYCNGSEWNQPFPECKAINPNPGKSCDFETDLCGWTQDPKGAWIRKEQESISENGHEPGNYVFLGNSSSRVQNATERIFSPVFPPGYATNSCFAFRYLLRGKDAGYLKVYVKQEGEELDSTIPSFWTTGNQGPGWLPGYFPLYPTDVAFQIIVEGMSLSRGESETAFDDVKIKSGEECLALKLDYLDNLPATSTAADTADDDDNDGDGRSCKNRCGTGASETEGKCGCDESCSSRRTCCSDYNATCGNPASTEASTSVSARDEFTNVASVKGFKTSTEVFTKTRLEDTSTSTTRRSTTGSAATSSRRRINRVNLQMHADPSLSVQMTKSRLDEMTKDKIYSAGGDSPQLMKSEGEKSKSTSGTVPAGTTEAAVAVAAVLICTSLAVAFIRRRRRKKTEKESMVEDSDSICFGTSPIYENFSSQSSLVCIRGKGPDDSSKRSSRQV